LRYFLPLTIYIYLTKLYISRPETVFLNFQGAQESIPPAYVAWRAGTTTLFLLSSYNPHRLF
jgi:hypothetical protein